MPYILVKELPDTLQSALKTLSYAKKDVQVLVQATESLIGNAGKGYQSFASVVDMGSGEVKSFVGSWGGSNPFNPSNMVDNNMNDYPIPHNIAIVRGFRGGASGTTHATITISPSNTLPCLTTGGSELIPSCNRGRHPFEPRGFWSCCKSGRYDCSRWSICERS
jgi:hypothetical protein